MHRGGLQTVGKYLTTFSGRYIILAVYTRYFDKLSELLAFFFQRAFRHARNGFLEDITEASKKAHNEHS
jgi:hypothetical protein